MTDPMYCAMAQMLAGTAAEVAIITAIGAAARLYGINENLFYGQIWAESCFNPFAVNPRSGCLGLGQMNPRYWPTATLEVESNLALSARFMKSLLAQYDQDYEKALVAYNFGSANLNDLIDEHGEHWAMYIPRESSYYLDRICDDRQEWKN